MSDVRNIGLEVKRDLNEIANDIIDNRNRKIEEGVEYPHSIRAEVYSSEEDPLYAFKKAFSSSNIMMTPDPDGSGSMKDFAQLMNYTWENENGGTDLEAMVPDQPEHVPVLRNATQALREKGYRPEVEIDGVYTRDNIEEAVNAVENNGARVEMWMHDGPQGEETISESLYTKANYHPERKQLEPDVQVATSESDPDKAEEIQNDLERILEKEGLLR